jgi:hypothetical protein
MLGEITDINHRVVSGLSSGWVFLGWVTNDSESWFVGNDLDLFNLVEVSGLEELVFVDESEDSFDGSSRLVLVETQLEVHTVDGEIASIHTEDDVERRLVTFNWFELSEDGFWVSEDVLWSDESEHGSLHGEDGGFGGDTGGGSLRVTQLLSGSDGSERNVVSNSHTDGRLNLLETGTHQSSVGDSGGDGTVNDVIDSVVLESKHFSESSSDFVTEKHRLESEGTVDVLVLVGSSDRNWVEIVVSEFSGLVSLNSISVSENGSVGIPFSDSGGVGADGLLSQSQRLGSEASGVSLFSGVESGALDLVLESFVLEHGWGVGSHGQSRDSAKNGVSVEKLGSLEGLLGWVTVLEEVLGVLGKLDGLVLGSKQGDTVRESFLVQSS